MTEKHQKLLWIIAFAVFVLFCLLTGGFIGVPMVRLAREPEAFRLWVDSFGFWGRLVFVAMVVLQVIVALIPGEPLELAAGYAFGSMEGTILSMVGILIGSWVVFAAVRAMGPKLVSVFFPDKEVKRLAFLRNPRKVRVLTFILMTIPGTPKDMLSYFSGLTPLTVSQWLGIVAIARIPSVITSTISGAAAGEENYLLAAIVLVLTIAASAIGILYYRKLSNDSEKDFPENKNC